MNAFFSQQRECNNYIYSISHKALNKMAYLSNIGEMRDWLHQHPEDPFSELVAKVQVSTLKYGVLYPDSKSDQIKITSTLYHILRDATNSDEHSCDVDVGEIMAERMYFGVHGAEAPIFKYLRQRGIRGPNAQREAFLVGLMAGELPAQWK